MIVKDESHIIKDTLTHLLKYFKFSYWVISDTGSTDGTQQIIKDFFKEHKIPGELDETPWRDFGYNRTIVFEKAFGKADYVFVWDADDEICGNFYLPQPLTCDGYHFTFGNAGGLRYKRLQLFKNTLRWKYEGVLHEYPVCIDKHKELGYIVGDYYFISGRKGSRNKDPKKYEKDAAILEKAFLETEKAGRPDTRYCFYTAQSYGSANDYENAIVWYKKNLTLQGWAQEKYVSCLRLFEMLMAQGKEAEALFYCVESFQYVPNRLECIFELIKYYCIKKMPLVSISYYMLIHDYFEKKYLEDNIGSNLFCRKEIGDFHLPYFMIIVGQRTQRYDIAIRNMEILVKAKFPHISEWHAHNVVFNLQFLIDKLDPKRLDFLEDLVEWRTQLSSLGINFKPEHNKILESVIQLYRPTLGAPHSTFTLSPNIIFPRVLFSITTCKRLDLFKQTINSIFRTWKDIQLVDYWLCVDDNSTEEDRAEMRKLYPWFDFRMKTPEQKGHRASMNIIWNALQTMNPVYWIHLEDDWIFFKKENYVTRAIQTLDTYKDKNIHQILFNRNYAELYAEHGWSIQGGKKLDPYTLLHVKDMPVQGPNSCYWPHYSFRPSVVRTKAVLELGNFDSPNTFFERDYANRWHAKGYQSAFFDTITCLHTGKLTSDTSGTNAYKLNDTNQFSVVESSPLSKPLVASNTYIVNLKRRPDRKSNVEAIFKKYGIQNYSFFEAVDGKELQPSQELSRLFAGNDFGNKRGVIGCALSHLALWMSLYRSEYPYYIIFEDDIRVPPSFTSDYTNASKWFGKYDVLFLGYHIQKGHEQKIQQGKGEPIPLERSTFIGGTFGYVITKKGAEKLLIYIQQNGIKHGIDYLMKLVPDLEIWSYQPHIVFSDWMGNNPNMDSDIQTDHTSLILPVATDDWVFLPGLDSGDNDIQFVGRKSHHELLEIAAQNSSCVAFNTLGFLKSAVRYPLQPSGYFKHGDGTYIRKSMYEKREESTKPVAGNIVSCTLIGGLGNRLFQAAATLGFAERYNYTPVFCKDWIRPSIHQNSTNVLSFFPEIPYVKSLDDPLQIKEKDCDTHSYIPFSFPIGAKHIRLDGFYQNPGYFPSAKFKIPFEKIIGAARFSSLQQRYSLQTTQDRFKTWFIHIRLGDYTKNGDVNHITFANYHSLLLPKIPPTNTILVFSDEPDKALTEIQKITERKVILCKEKDEIECLALMSLCWGGAIVPNSTFSWWGAYLAHETSEAPSRFQAFYPKIWRAQYGEKGAECIPTWGHAFNPPTFTRVKMLCNWCSSEQLCSDWDAMSKGNRAWNTIQITSEDTNIDYWVIINKPPPGAKYDPKRTIVFQMEPWCGEPWQTWGVKTWGEWAKPDPAKFLQVRSHDKFYNNGFWQLSYTYSQLKNAIPEKTMGNRISTICSTKYFDPGHKYRIDFLKFLESKADSDVQFDFWNTDNKFNFKNYKGPLTPHKDKERGLLPYKYYFMCENNAEKNFITEKLWEPLLTESLVFYWGCPNVSDYIDPRAYVQLDMNNFELSFQIIKKAIKEDWWRQRLPYIRVEKQKFLETYQFFPTLERVITEDIYSKTFADLSGIQTACFIHSCNLSSDPSSTERLDMLLECLERSGLQSKLDLLVIQNCGVPLPESTYQSKYPKVKILQWSDRTDLYELPTLKLIHWFSQRFSDCKLLYLHTKGISYARDSAVYKNSTDWIAMMLHFLVNQYEDCLDHLETNEVLGCNYEEYPRRHYSGNFWWAQTKYLKRLPIWNLSQKMDAEWWLHSAQPKWMVLYTSSINHFQQPFPKTNYETNKLNTSNTLLYLPYYYEDITSFKKDPRIVPVKIEPQTHFQEYWTYNLIDLNTIPESIEYIGFVCSKFHEKSRGFKLQSLNYYENYDCVHSYNNPRSNKSYLDIANEFHPNFKRIWYWLLEQLGFDPKTFQHSKIHIYSNMWLAPKHIAIQYVEFAKKVLPILENAPPHIEALLKSNSTYNGKHPKDALIKMYGVPYYQYYPFIMERLMCLFCDIHKIPVV